MFRLATYYTLYQALFITFFCKWLKTRYGFLEKCLTIQRKVPFHVVFFEKDEEKIFGKLDEFAKFYKALFTIVNDFNKLFEWTQFSLTVCTVLSILNGSNFVIVTKDVKKDLQPIIIHITYPILYLIFTVQIAISCDQAEKSGQKIVKTCQMLFETATKPTVKTRIFQLVGFSEGLAPYFCAGGFWLVNRRVLSALFSSLVTYLIIIIQFSTIN